MSKLISVIIPVYNVGLYLSECFESIINQTYDNFEVIVVDDGSTDRSGKICDEYAKKDNRFKIIHKSNGGSASAKNVALKNSTGEYLIFVDSDDFIEKDAFMYLVNKLEDTESDIVQCSYRDVYTNKSIDNICHNEEFTAESYLLKFTEDWTCSLLWDKIYKRHLFDNVFFEEGHVVDDEYFTYQGVINAKKIIRDEHIIYNYRKRKSSVSYLPEHMERIIFDKLDYLSKRRNLVTSKFYSLKKDYDLYYANMLIWLSRDPFLSKKSVIMIKKMVSDFLKEKGRSKLNFSITIALYRILFARTGSIINNTRKPDNIDSESYYK